MRAAEQAARSMRAFGATLEAAIESSVRELGTDADPVVSIEWSQGNLTHLAATLRSGRVIRGVGEAKLEAVLDASGKGPL